MRRHPALLQDYWSLNSGDLESLSMNGQSGWCVRSVYFYATQASDCSRVNDVFGDVQAMMTFGVLAKELSRSFMPQEVVTRAELADVVQQADHVLVGAYDSAGMLIWSKP